MNIQQKAEALDALSEISIKIRCADDWYINQSVEIKDGSILKSLYGNGSTPDQAIEDHWNVITNLEHGQYIVVNAYNENRQAVKWNGYMWENVVEKNNEPPT